VNRDGGNGRRLLTGPRTILLVLWLTISVGCVTMAPQVRQKPIRPVIDAYRVDGGVCFTNDDMQVLFKYILELEAGFER
jgi:hypothetical protein